VERIDWNAWCILAQKLMPKPEMFLTVTLNTGVDRVLLIDQLLLGGPVKARKEVVCVGGKGLDVSVALRGLGLPTVGLSCMAGQNGRLLEEIITAYGIQPDSIWVEGETRVSYVIAEASHRRVSHIQVGELLFRPEHVNSLLEHYVARLETARFAILAGSIPAALDPGLYAELTHLAQAASVPVLIDSRGAPVLNVLSCPPDILKQNWDEFNSTFGLAARTLEELQAAARQVQAQYSLNALVITCGADGILAVRPATSYRVIVPPQAAINAAGAGDAASAGLAWRLSEGDSWEQALKWCGAVSAAAVLTEATGEVSLADVERLYPRVKVLVEE
jgi:1-phosphofructokinase family hexose kinase